MVHTALDDTSLVETTPTALKNEVSTFWKMYYDKETWIMLNQSVNEFYTQFVLKIDVLPPDVVFMPDFATRFSNNLSPNVRYFLISEGVQVHPSIPTETNNQGNQRLLLVRNAAVEAEKKRITIKCQ